LKIVRGDVVTVVLQGNYGKPRPAVVVQSNVFPDHSSLTICPLTSHLVDAPLFRINIAATAQNGLIQTSQIMIDKIVSVPKEKIGGRLGRLPNENILEINQALALWVGLV